MGEGYYSNIPFDPLSIYTTLYLRTLLKLFWRDIANKLDSKTTIKIQIRIQLKQNKELN